VARNGLKKYVGLGHADAQPAGGLCGRSRRGRFALKRKSRGDRMRAKLKEIKEEMRQRRHQPIPEQGKWLRQVVSGFFEYHAVPTNSQALRTFRHHVTNLWRR
jgi:RNA-directed DNA polymerase